MTIKHYLYDQALTGASIITDLVLGERPYIVLNETWFHPQGGGQQSDKGTINGCNVTSVRHNGNDVNHYVESINNLQLGQNVTLIIEKSARFLNSASHTAGHLISALVEENFHGCKASKGHHWLGEARVEFIGELPSTESVLDYLPQALIKSIDADFPIKTHIDNEQKRSVQINEFPPVGCGGTHLKSLKEMPELQITNVKIKKGSLRVSYNFSE